MKIKEISYLNRPSDLVDDCLDVIIQLEDDYCVDEFCYVVEVTTPEFLSSQMKESKSDFLPPDYPYIIVSKLTKEIIEAAIQSYVDEEEDSFWLKLYCLPAILEIEDINKILDQKKQESIELDAKIDAESDLNE